MSERGQIGLNGVMAVMRDLNLRITGNRTLRELAAETVRGELLDPPRAVRTGRQHGEGGRLSGVDVAMGRVHSSLWTSCSVQLTNTSWSVFLMWVIGCHSYL